MARQGGTLENLSGYVLMFVVLLIVTSLLVTLTALPILRAEVWWVRALAFPRLQIVATTLVVLLLDLWLLYTGCPWSWWLVGAALACLAWQAWWIWPYTRLHKIEVQPAGRSGGERRLRLLSANVLGSNRRADGFLELVRDNDPDIVLTLESNAWWQQRLDELEAEYPHTIKCPLENLYGMHVYSRLPLSETRVDYLVRDDVPSMHACITLRSGDKVRAHFLHPKPPSPTEAKTSSGRDAELVIVARSMAEDSAPTIIAGDLITSPGRIPRGCSASSADCSIHVSAVACSTPSMPPIRFCAGRSITCSTAPTSSCANCAGFRPSARITLRCSVNWNTSTLTKRHSERRIQIAMIALRADAKARDEGVGPEEVPKPGVS